MTAARLLLLPLLIASAFRASANNLCADGAAPAKLKELCQSDDPHERAYGWNQGWYCHHANGQRDGCHAAQPDRNRRRDKDPAQTTTTRATATRSSSANIAPRAPARSPKPGPYAGCARSTHYPSGRVAIQCHPTKQGSQLIYDLRDTAPDLLIFE